MTDQPLRKQLSRHITFVRISCDAYDQGMRGEAVRIGTALRVLLHDTADAPSLLRRLRAKQVPLLSTCGAIRAPTHMVLFDGLVGISAGKVDAKLGRTTARVERCADEWWMQTVSVRDGRAVSRAVIALTADAALVRGVWSNGGVARVPDHYLMYLRQMGYEILNSPQLAALAG